MRHAHTAMAVVTPVGTAGSAAKPPSVVTFTITFTQNGGTVTGSYTDNNGNIGTVSGTISNGTTLDVTVTFTGSSDTDAVSGTLHLTGTVVPLNDQSIQAGSFHDMVVTENFDVTPAGGSLSHHAHTAQVTIHGRISVPHEPMGLIPTAGDSLVALTWMAPAVTGGAAITDYVVEYKASTDSAWTTFADGVSTTTAATVTGLNNLVEYNFRVSAKNSAGVGAVSATATATPVFSVVVTVPGAPTSLTPTAADSSVALTWTAPSANGGAAITDYVVEYKASTDSTWTTFADGAAATAAATVTGLTNGTTYDFRVSAKNSAGIGAVSATATATPVAIVVITVPDAPTSLTPTAGDGSVALTWTAPSVNGGAAITDYVIEYKASTDSTWMTFADGVSDVTSAMVTGLTNGTSYDFRVSAKNGAGIGEASVAATATPVAPVIGISGTWSGAYSAFAAAGMKALTMAPPPGVPVPHYVSFTITFLQTGGTVTGGYVDSDGNIGTVAGTINGTTLDVIVTFVGSNDGDMVNGTLQLTGSVVPTIEDSTQAGSISNAQVMEDIKVIPLDGSAQRTYRGTGTVSSLGDRIVTPESPTTTTGFVGAWMVPDSGRVGQNYEGDGTQYTITKTGDVWDCLDAFGASFGFTITANPAGDTLTLISSYDNGSGTVYEKHVQTLLGNGSLLKDIMSESPDQQTWTDIGTTYNPRISAPVVPTLAPNPVLLRADQGVPARSQDDLQRVYGAYDGTTVTLQFEMGATFAQGTVLEFALKADASSDHAPKIRGYAWLDSNSGSWSAFVNRQTFDQGTGHYDFTNVQTWSAGTTTVPNQQNLQFSVSGNLITFSITKAEWASQIGSTPAHGDVQVWVREAATGNAQVDNPTWWSQMRDMAGSIEFSLPDSVMLETIGVAKDSNAFPSFPDNSDMLVHNTISGLDSMVPGMFVGYGSYAGQLFTSEPGTPDTIDGIKCIKVPMSDVAGGYFWLARAADNTIYRIKNSDNGGTQTYLSASSYWIEMPATLTQGQKVAVRPTYVNGSGAYITETMTLLHAQATAPHSGITGCAAVFVDQPSSLSRYKIFYYKNGQMIEMVETNAVGVQTTNGFARQ